MFTSSAAVFRIRQSLGDLRAYLRESGPSVRDRLAASVRSSISVSDARARIDRVVDEQGARFAIAGDDEAHEVTRLAASLPSDDFPAFTFATALLLADRLQSGAQNDDLYWNWDAFRDDYALADPPIRAVLMNGFRIGEETGRVSIGDPPKASECLTRSHDEVLRLLRDAGAADTLDLVTRDPSAEDAGLAWVDASRLTLPEASLVAFRYLFERPQSLVPRRAADAPLIPWHL